MFVFVFRYSIKEVGFIVLFLFTIIRLLLFVKLVWPIS